APTYYSTKANASGRNWKWSLMRRRWTMSVVNFLQNKRKSGGAIGVVIQLYLVGRVGRLEESWKRGCRWTDEGTPRATDFAVRVATANAQEAGRGGLGGFT